MSARGKAAKLVDELRSHSDLKRLAHAKKMGVPSESAFGVSTSIVRKMGRGLEKDNVLAKQLWRTGYHEARLLAVLIIQRDAFRTEDIDDWLDDVVSWDLCDQICKNIVRFRSDANDLVFHWAKDHRTYVRRAALATIANLAIHQDDIPSDLLLRFLETVGELSDDSRLHVRKAASWALRELGKRSFEVHDFVVAVVADLGESESRHTRWVARDALKELDTLVSVPQRRRLLTSKSKMGKLTRLKGA